MSKVRMFDDEAPEGQGQDRQASPRTTIVGGRPPESGDGLPPVPTGIESLLRLAAVDPAFRALLLDRRDVAAAAAGVALTPSERAILRVIPGAQIAAMAERLPPPPPPRRTFLRQAAASAVVALGGAALASCDGCAPSVTRGAQPDMPPPRPDYNEMQSDGGAAPDLPPPRPQEPMPPTGIAPDLPPPRPDANLMQTRGGAAPHEPPPKPDAVPEGITPDLPPSRPDYNDMQSEGGAAPDLPPERPQPNVSRGISPDVPRTRGHSADLPVSPYKKK